MSGRQSQVPQVIADYFKRYMIGGEHAVLDSEAHPVIYQTFTPGKGWTRYPGRKRVSCSWVRKLRREGVTCIAVVSPYWPNRVVDVTVAAVLKGGPVR